MKGRMRGKMRGEEETKEEGKEEEKNGGRKRKVRMKKGRKRGERRGKVTDSSPHPVGPRRRILLLPSCGPSFFSVAVWGGWEAWSML